MIDLTTTKTGSMPTIRPSLPAPAKKPKKEKKASSPKKTKPVKEKKEAVKPAKEKKVGPPKPTKTPKRAQKPASRPTAVAVKSKSTRPNTKALVEAATLFLKYAQSLATSPE